MQNSITAGIFAILDSVKADFPRRKHEAETLIRERGLKAELQMEIAPSRPTMSIPTFDANKSRELSPMMRARFEYAGSWKMGQDIWLDTTEMASAVHDNRVRAQHKSKREHWDGSAPMLFSDDRLALFALTDDVPENAAYLVWASDCDEPEVWDYAGYDFLCFKNLADFLT